MIVIGLTGSLAMGKSVAAAMLRGMKIPVHDADATVHALLARGGAGVLPVRAAFPGSADTDMIDRARLRAALGSDETSWRQLESILHPLVREKEVVFLREARAAHRTLAALDIPLLFETGGEVRVDVTLCVTAPAFLQAQRARHRGMSNADLAARLARQMPDAEKRRRADFVVQTGNGHAYTYRALENILRQLRP